MRVKNYYKSYLNYLIQRGLDPETIKDHKGILYGALSHCVIENKKIKNLKLVDIASVIEAGRKHGKYGSQKAVLVFKQFLKFLKDNNIKIPFDYRDVEIPRVPEKIQPVLDKKNLIKLLNSVSLNTITGLRLRTLLEVLFATGGRIGEILGLNTNSIDWNKREAIVIQKGKNEGIVYFTNRSLYWLKRYLKKRTDNHPALFVNKSGTARLKQTTSRASLLKFKKKYHFNLNHHLFRRTLATYLIEKGADIKSVQHIMRHRSERTTLRYYISVNEKRAKRIHQKLVNFK